MNKTRNLFVLKSHSQALISKVLKEVNFKGCITFSKDKEITEKDIKLIYNLNRSIICDFISDDLAKDYNAFYIYVINKEEMIASEFNNVIDVSKDIVSQFQNIAIKNNCDIGDHISNSSGANEVPSIKDCVYCDFLMNYKENQQRAIIYESDNFFSFTTLGQFIPGYLLLIPKEHIMSIAELDSNLMQEFKECLDDCCEILKLTFHCQNILVSENGTGNSGKGISKNSIVHAHVHLTCSNLDSEYIKSVSGFIMEEITLDDLNKYGNHSYLLLKNRTGNGWKINDVPGVYIPRQYIRQLLAEEAGLENDLWNWRTHPFHEQRHQATVEIQNALKENWNFLSNRIKQRTQEFVNKKL